MSYTAQFTEYPVAEISKLLATNYGAHIFNVTPDDTLWNGALITKGDMISFDNYEEGDASDSTINAKIVWKASNGLYYVEILEDTDVLFVCNVPITPFDNLKKYQDRKYFCIKAADGDVARAHQLKAGDIFGLSASGFSGTPEVGATISSISGKKPVITEVTG